MNSFNPLVLDRTVIAIPLLRELQQDIQQTQIVRQQFPAEARRFNTAIRFNPDFPGGGEAAMKRIAEMLLVFSSKTKTPRRFVLKQSWIFAQLDASAVRHLIAENGRIAEPDRRPIAQVLPSRFEIIIDINLDHPGGRDAARRRVLEQIEEAKKLARIHDEGQGVQREKDQPDSQYIFARLEAPAIQKLVELDRTAARAQAPQRANAEPTDSTRYRSIHHIWPDFEVSACINASIATVKSDAARTSFSAEGAGITWAVMDSGIESGHRHFRQHSNIDPASVLHGDFIGDGAGPLRDANGHGTHVAGIIAGEWPPDGPGQRRPIAISRYVNTETGDVEYQPVELPFIRGMAPKCRLVSLRVLDDYGKGSVSNLIAAINHVHEKNAGGRRLAIHGVNISLGYNFEPEWFACGQSPLCVEVDRLVKSGVVVVVAAGNTGFGTVKSSAGTTSAGLGLTINDPGNADLAITVGSTHRDMPHIYGVSYFSSKGPTGDGRLKPDLVAPGEKIISCAAGRLRKEGANEQECDYVETSGTSMAAPHVSGVIAAFLSVRREFIGQPERVKELFLSTAMDLRRDRNFQGAGLVDLMRAIQSV